jgi:hypothetical protein
MILQKKCRKGGMGLGLQHDDIHHEGHLALGIDLQ